MKKDLLAGRGLAFEWLDEVLVRRRTLDDAMETVAAHPDLAARDRSFARLLTMTVLRRLGQIDAMIDHCLEHPLPGRARAAKTALRLGVAQLMFLDTPPHAAVDNSVRLAVARRANAYKKLVNAVLRRIAREGAAWRDAQDAALLNTPDWLWESWTATYGDATARAIAEAHMTEPMLDVSAKGEPGKVAEALDGSVLANGTVRRPGGGRVDELPGFADGDWWVQDAAAALPARLLGAGPGDAVIDLCAAPGGKTAQLSAAGISVTAVDRSPARLRRLNANLARLGLAATSIEADCTTWCPDSPATRVLLDAPCSATGTIRRHPDIPYLKNADDVTAAATAQRRLLENAAAMVAPGGTLVYAVCSLQSEEGPDQITALLDGGTDFARQPIRADEIGGMASLITNQGDLRTLPCHMADQGGMDGFFAARLVRER
jgi:16S rRNA (cytosine967-C5)-methyltransferase